MMSGRSSPYVPLSPTWGNSLKINETFDIVPVKQCPFCPRRHYDYKYKTFRGLLKHISETHCRGDPGGGVEVKRIRVYESLYNIFEDFPVNGWNHVIEIVRAYCKGQFNPSLRMNGERYKKVFGYS